MRHNLLRMTVALMLLWPGIAMATTLDSVDGTADCNGWTADVQVTFTAGGFLVHLESVVELTDQDGNVVDQFDSGEFLTIVPDQTVTLSYGGQWSAPLDTPHKVRATFVLADIVADGGNEYMKEFTVAIDCGVPVKPAEPVCIYWRGWWVRHTVDWPVTSLELGGVAYDQDALLGMMKGRVMGDVTKLLARQLIPAKLNLANGAEDAISEVVAEADAYLARVGMTSRPHRRDRWPAVKLAIRLLMYNLRGCPDGAKAGEAYDEDEAYLKALEKEFVEPQSFGAVKSMYR